jgi:DNA helicase IV
MVAKEIIQREQEFVDTAVEARESRRSDRESGKYSLAGALATPIKTMAGGKLQKLKELGDKSEDVCFANVINEDNERHYIGKFAIHNSKSDLLVSSWKSEVGALFYRSSINAPLGLAGKCRILFDKPNHVKDVEENLYKELQTRIQNLTRNPESDVSDAVLDELEKGSSGSLKEIIKTIHASQYEIISAKRGGLHVIQGAPGTGKTVVGVHRASWLLFPGNDEDLKAEKTLIVGPNIAFIRYIENVVPSLGDEKIVHKDLSKLGPTVLVTGEEDRRVAKIKGDPRMKDLLLQAIRDRVKLPEADVVFNPPGQNRSIELSAEGIRTKMQQLLDDSIFGVGRTSYMNSRAIFKNWLLNSVNEILKQGNQLDPKSNSRVAYVKESDVDSLIERGWPSLSPASFLRDFYSSQGRVINAAREMDFQIKELILLERKPSPQISKEVWTVADVALLDFLENQLQGTDPSDQFDYIIVDEAQDMTPMQLESIRRRSGSGDLLLMGDLAQATGPWVHSSWNAIADCVNKPIERMDELEFGYRVPKQVFEYASKVLSHINPLLKSPRLVRDVTESPIVKISDDYDELIDQLIEDLEELTDSTTHTGLIIGDKQVESIVEALTNAGVAFSLLENNSPIEGLNIVPVSRQKGLEFDDVILVEPQEIIDIPEIGLRQLYVAVTRSLRGLTMYACEKLPIQLREESVISEEFDLDSLIAELDLMIEPEEPTSGFDEIKRDVEGYLRVKGLTLKEFIKKVRNSGGEDL